MQVNFFVSQIAILTVITSGFVLTKLGLVNSQFRKQLTDLVICFIMPCNIIKSFLMELDMQVLKAGVAVLVLSVLIQVLSFAAGKLLYPRADPRRRGSLQFATMVSNSGYLGNPIMESLYGAQGVLYASLYSIPQRVMMWSVGLACFTGSRGKGVLKKTCKVCEYAIWTNYEYSDNPATNDFVMAPMVLMLTTGAALTAVIADHKRRRV